MLFIAEKPAVAKAIVAALGTNFRQEDGYYTNGKDTVTWCIGHLLSLKEPHDYDPRYRHWTMQDLPIRINRFDRKIKEDKGIKKQYNTIVQLIKKADVIVNAGDPDEEGQLLVDEILREVSNNKPVKRILINDNNTKVVAKAIANMEDNSKYEYMGYRAEARSIADLYFGVNLSRAYSLYHQSTTNSQDKITLGRVQTAILGLIVRRDLEFSAHKVSYYYNVTGDFIIDSSEFTAKLVTPPNLTVDDKNRLLDENQAKAIASYCKDKAAKIKSSETVNKSIPPLLPYNLLKLQQDCAKLFDYSPSETLAITQRLRENYQLITYNRSDCQYLSEEQHADAAAILKCIGHNLPTTQLLVSQANTAIKSRAFNSAKVSAHHAIVPTEKIADCSKLSSQELNVFKLIVRAYIAQFFPDYLYEQTKLTVSVDHYDFSITGHVPVRQGWKVLYAKDTETNEDDSEQVLFIDLRQLKEGNLGVCSDTAVKQEQTKPKPLYTIPTLLGDLTSASKYIRDPHLAKILKERDKDKQGESGGIGTPATRDSIINKLFERNYIVQKNKNIISTDLGKNLYNQLSDKIRYPDLTALWTEQFNKIHNQEQVKQFIDYVFQHDINQEVEQIRKICPALVSTPQAPCPKCGRPMTLKTGKFGPYWACTGYFDQTDQCIHIMNDDHGKPVEKTKQVKPLSEFDCKTCGAKLVKFEGTSKKTGKPYSKFNCSNFPKCKQDYWEKDGKPDYK